MDEPEEQYLRFGYLEANGQTIVEPSFEWAGDFEQGAAKVLQDGSWGLIGLDGSWVLEPTYTLIKPFVGGFAQALSRQGGPIWIDRQGHERFSHLEGLWYNGELLQAGNVGGIYDPATRHVHGGRYQVFDAAGKPRSGLFAEGEKPACWGGDRLLIERSGAWQVRSLTGAPLGPENEGPHGIISGRRIVFSEGGLCGAYDDCGRLAFEPRFRTLADFNDEGVAIAWAGGEELLIVNREGAAMGEIKGASFGEHHKAYRFENGLAKVVSTATRDGYESRANVLRRDGTWVFEHWVHDVDVPPLHGSFLVKKDRSTRLALFDLEGVSRLDPEPANVLGWIENWGFRVQTEPHQRRQRGRTGVLGAHGRWVISPEYMSIGDPLDTERIAVATRTDGRWGVLRRDGSWAIDPIYDGMVVGEGAVAVATGGELDANEWGTGLAGAHWKLLRGDGTVIVDLGACPWEPGPLREGRMRFCSG